MKNARAIVRSLLEDVEPQTKCHECGSENVETDGSFYACMDCDNLWSLDERGQPRNIGDKDLEDKVYGTYGIDPVETNDPSREDILGDDDAVDWGRWQRSGYKDPDPVPLETKMKHKVFEHGHFIIIKMPADEQFIRREGFDMQHCLLVAYREYCERLKTGQQVQFSLVDTRDGLPKVDFELSLETSSYGGPVTKPVITQIRGIRNQCPPKDEYLPALMAFFEAHPEWQVSGHGVLNFDGGIDGDKVVARWKQLQGGQA